MQKLITGVVLFLALLIGSAHAHCEIPCGIYDDGARIIMLSEHITTMEKSVKQIKSLQKDKKIDYNQLVRWINNKDEHANQFQQIVTQYFMTQRIKPGQDNYEQKIRLLHEMLIASMKCKQNVDTKYIKQLRKLVKEFEQLYIGNK